MLLPNFPSRYSLCSRDEVDAGYQPVLAAFGMNGTETRRRKAQNELQIRIKKAKRESRSLRWLVPRNVGRDIAPRASEFKKICLCYGLGLAYLGMGPKAPLPFGRSDHSRGIMEPLGLEGTLKPTQFQPLRAGMLPTGAGC